MPISEEVREAVASTNFKSLGEGPSFYANLAMGDSVAHQRGVNTIRESALGSIVKSLTESDPTEAVSVLKMLSGNDQAQQLQSLLAAIASGQQVVKTAQSTPPETAKQ